MNRFAGFTAIQRADLLNKRAHGFRVDRDSERYLMPRPVVAQLQVEGVEQLTLFLLGQERQVDGSLR